MRLSSAALPFIEDRIEVDPLKAVEAVPEVEDKRTVLDCHPGLSQPPSIN